MLLCGRAQAWLPVRRRGRKTDTGAAPPPPPPPPRRGAAAAPLLRVLVRRCLACAQVARVDTESARLVVSLPAWPAHPPALSPLLDALLKLSQTESLYDRATGQAPGVVAPKAPAKLQSPAAKGAPEPDQHVLRAERTHTCIRSRMRAALHPPRAIYMSSAATPPPPADTPWLLRSTSLPASRLIEPKDSQWEPVLGREERCITLHCMLWWQSACCYSHWRPAGTAGAASASPRLSAGRFQTVRCWRSSCLASASAPDWR